METFTPPRPFTTHPRYHEDREEAHRDLRDAVQKKAIDAPLLPIVQECLWVPHCFTVQCCFGHFVHACEPDRENLVPVSRYSREVGRIEYRIAYLALCLENSPAGHGLYSELEKIAAMDPEFIQFGSADWFWEQVPNIYCLQLEPERMKHLDSGNISWEEAIRIENLRGPFFSGFMGIMHRHRVRCGS